jgi:hypothetical protein
MQPEAMICLVEHLADAKSRRNVPDALEVLHDEMLLETPAIGSVVRGKAANQVALTRFFASFPDYSIKLEKKMIDQAREEDDRRAQHGLLGNGTNDDDRHSLRL